jgi:hypothetical protein
MLEDDLAAGRGARAPCVQPAEWCQSDDRVRTIELHMPKSPRIIGLDVFGLTGATVLRLGARPVHLSIQLTGETVSKLWHLRPKQRDATLRETLAKQPHHLRRDFPAVEFVSRGKDKPSWTIDAVAPANQLPALASRWSVKTLMIDTIEGRRPRVRRPSLAWFCVCGVVAIQIEGQIKGSLDLEDVAERSHAINAFKPSRSTSSKSVSAPLKSSKNPTRMDAMMLFDSTSTPLPPTQFRLGNYSFWRPSASRNSSIPRRVKPSSSGTPMPTHSTTRHVSSRRKLTYQGQCPSGVEM